MQTLDLKALFKALHEFGCAGRILCESPILEEDALNMKKAWMKRSGEKEKQVAGRGGLSNWPMEG